MPTLYLVTPRASGGGQISAADINQLVNTLTGNQNTPVSIKNTDPIAYTLQLQNTDAAGKTLLLYGPDGTTVILRSQGNGVVASPDGTAAAPIVTTTHPQALSNKTFPGGLVVTAGPNTLGPGLTQLTTYACRVNRSVVQGITSSAATAITFDQERYKTDAGMHSTVTNTSRLTATVAGKYRISGHISWAASVAGTFRALYIRLNGATIIASDQRAPVNNAAVATEMSITTEYAFALNDYVELVVNQDSGGLLNIQALSNYSAEFAMSFVSA